MQIAWSSFTPLQALLGGLLIGLAAALFLLGNGRIAGIAGIVASPWMALRQRGWAGLLSGAERSRLVFLAGLLLAPWVWRLFAPWPGLTVDVGPLGLVAGGLLVGVGVRMANGCTSGHGVCGLSRLSLRSLLNVLVFMAAGFATVWLMRHGLA